MYTLVVIVILAVASAVFATQNTQTTVLHFGDYVLEPPLYLIVLVSIGVGLLCAIFMHIVKDLSALFAIKGYRGQIKKLKEEVVLLTKEHHKFELENTKLKAKTGEKEFDEDSM